MFENIFHPSDFTQTSQVAFCHALKLALAANAELEMLHVVAEGTHGSHHDFPSVRSILEKWKVLPPGSRRRAVTGLGIDVQKIVRQSSHPVQAVTDFLNENPSSLIVLAAHRHARTTWLGHSKAEPISRHAAITTLFIPDSVAGFVSTETGQLSLRTIVIPVALDPPCTSTVQSVCNLLETLKIEAADVHLLHVGSDATQPAIAYPSSNKIRFHSHLKQGDVVPTILQTSQELQADLLAMTTAGHHGFLDAVRGNTTEQVLRQIACPLWAVTARS